MVLPTKTPAVGRTLVAVAIWVLKFLLALLGVGSAIMNLLGLGTSVAEFDLIGLGQWFRYVTGIWLLFGSVLLLWPATTGLGAALLCAVCIGAGLAQAFILHDDVIHAIVPAVICGAIAFAHRNQISAFLSGRLSVTS